MEMTDLNDSGLADESRIEGVCRAVRAIEEVPAPGRQEVLTAVLIGGLIGGMRSLLLDRLLQGRATGQSTGQATGQLNELVCRRRRQGRCRAGSLSACEAIVGCRRLGNRLMRGVEGC